MIAGYGHRVAVPQNGAVKISLLGPVEVRLPGGGLADLGGARLRALLIRLALDPGRIVTQTSLIDAVWGEEPPANAVNALQALVSRLRRIGLPIDGHQAGYRLGVERSAVDAYHFEDLVAAREFDAALGLWRGP